MTFEVRENELISVQDFAFEESDTEAQVFSMYLASCTPSLSESRVSLEANKLHHVITMYRNIHVERDRINLT